MNDRNAPPTVDSFSGTRCLEANGDKPAAQKNSPGSKHFSDVGLLSCTDRRVSDFGPRFQGRAIVRRITSHQLYKILKIGT